MFCLDKKGMKATDFYKFYSELVDLKLLIKPKTNLLKRKGKKVQVRKRNQIFFSLKT